MTCTYIVLKADLVLSDHRPAQMFNRERVFFYIVFSLTTDPQTRIDNKKFLGNNLSQRVVDLDFNFPVNPSCRHPDPRSVSVA
jgi:hypothetical protein